ncbi:MAG: glycoside hydrolase family 65 protein [Planctomycetes bacterium]|nr:glycoside hydrolase family 65 protein [Planctomycetota bacterium]
MKTHSITVYRNEFQPAYLANGLVGLRVGKIPLLHGIALVNGFVGIHEKEGVEAYAPAPYPIGGDVLLDGVSIVGKDLLRKAKPANGPFLATFVRQSYDFSTGELLSRFDVRLGDKTARLSVVTFCSRALPTLVLQEIRAEVERPCTLALQALMDPAGLPGRPLLRSMPHMASPKIQCDAVLHWESDGGLSTCGAAFATEFLGEGEVKEVRSDRGYENDLQFKAYVADAAPGRVYTLRQFGCLVPSLMHSEPHSQALRLIGLARQHGFEKLREDNRVAWAELWKGRPLLVGAEQGWQETADAAFFYLHSSVHSSSPCSVAPFGLGQRDYYGGHVFWDCEGFMFLPVLLTAPESARAMLDYRSRCLPAARFNAALHGCRGALFPWQSGNSGSEVTGLWAGGTSGILEQHITLSVALAFSQYVHVSGDASFLRQQAWPVMEAVAEWVASRVIRTSRGYEIRHVTGPDEGADNVSNNAYTNIASILVLREARAVAQRIGLRPPARWAEVEQELFIPTNPETHEVLPHDAFVYQGGAFNPDVLHTFFPYNYSHSEKVDRATLASHVGKCQTYLNAGGMMHGPLMAVYAARLGNRRLAREALEKTILLSTVDPFVQFLEAGRQNFRLEASPDTVFLTGAGGFLMALVLGLPGLQIGPDEPSEWPRLPVVLPEGMDAIEVERLWVRGRPARLVATQGEVKADLIIQ